MSSPDDKGQAEIPADSHSEGKVRMNGSYIADALRACGGMVELRLTDARSPMLFAAPGYELVVMPMFTGETTKPKAEEKATEPTTAEASKPAEPEAVSTEAQESKVAQAVAEAEKPKRKGSKAKEPVAAA